MSIDHRRFDILVAEKLLDRSDVIATPKQVCGEGMHVGPLHERRNALNCAGGFE